MPISRSASPPRSFELRASPWLLAAALAWLVIASAGCLAARGLPPTLRVLLALATWALAVPGLRRDIALATDRSLRRVEHRGARRWRIARGARGASAEPAVAAQPSPHSIACGAVLWLRFDSRSGRHCACVVDRRLAARLRLAGAAQRVVRSNC